MPFRLPVSLAAFRLDRHGRSLGVDAAQFGGLVGIDIDGDFKRRPCRSAVQCFSHRYRLRFHLHAVLTIDISENTSACCLNSHASNAHEDWLQSDSTSSEFTSRLYRSDYCSSQHRNCVK